MELTIEQIKSITFGAVESTACTEGIEFYRMPLAQIQRICKMSEWYGVRAYSTAGIRLDFYTDSDYFSFSYDNVKQAGSQSFYYFTLYINEKEYSQIGEEDAQKFMGRYNVKLPKGKKRITLFFPNLFRARLKNVELSDGASIELAKKNKRVLFIGDSITQGYTAKSAANSYVNRFAFENNVEAINVAVGGARFEEYFIDENFFYGADTVVVAIGTNTWKYETKETFTNQCVKFFKKICSIYSNVPVFVILPIWREDEYQAELFEGPLVEAREIMSGIIGELAKEYPKLKVVDIWDKITHDTAYYTDGLHPNDEGMKLYANALLQIFRKEKMKLRNDKILIFGGGSGIGKAIAKRFLELGAKVLIVGRTEEKLLKTKEELGSKNLFVKVFDITNVDNHTKLFNEAEQTLGGLNGFVNSAAVGSGQAFGRGYEPWDITSDEWDMFTEIDFKGSFFLMRNEIDYLKSKGVRGNILNIASNAACMDIIGAYGASKQAIIKWTRAFGKRYGHDGIIINGIAPGATLTPMIKHYATDINQKYERHAIERFIRPEEIAELAFYLMSNFGEIVCGHTVVADGGDNVATR